MATPASSPITSRPAQVEFTNRFVQPPSSLYIFRDDKLFLRTQSFQTDLILRLRGRLLTPKGEVITLDFAHDTGGFVREPVMGTFDVAEGFLLGIAVTPPLLTLRRGEVFVTAGITRGGEVESTITQILFSGYIEGASSPSWPTGGIVSSTDGQGHLFRRLEADPSAGAEISIAVPANVRWRFISLFFTLVTDTTAANRQVNVEVIKNGTRVALYPANALQSASTTRSYTAGAIPVSQPALGTPTVIAMSEHLLLEEDDALNTVTGNIAAGDDFGLPISYVEEWMQEN